MSGPIQMHAAFRLVGVGRDKVTREVRCGRFIDLLREVGKHLRSREVDVADDGTVFVGGWRSVGHVVPLDDLAKEMLPLWEASETSARSAPESPRDPPPETA